MCRSYDTAISPNVGCCHDAFRIISGVACPWYMTCLGSELVLLNNTKTFMFVCIRIYASAAHSRRHPRSSSKPPGLSLEKRVYQVQCTDVHHSFADETVETRTRVFPRACVYKTWWFKRRWWFERLRGANNHETLLGRTISRPFCFVSFLYVFCVYPPLRRDLLFCLPSGDWRKRFLHGQLACARSVPEHR